MVINAQRPMIGLCAGFRADGMDPVQTLTRCSRGGAACGRVLLRIVAYPSVAVPTGLGAQRGVGVPDDHDLHAVVALGRLGDKSLLPDALQSREGAQPAAAAGQHRRLRPLRVRRLMRVCDRSQENWWSALDPCLSSSDANSMP
jgi:hypothetical protein